MRRQLLVGVVLVTLVVQPVGAMATPLVTPAGNETADAAASSAVDDAHNMTAVVPDPDTDRLGWEDGYWYNETIAVDRSDGLNESELETVVTRSMARVEYVRGMEFKRRPPVEVISRAQHRNDTSDRFANQTSTDRLFENVKFEALLMVGEQTSATAIQETHFSGGVKGYYDTETETIKIVSENTTAPKMDEITLSQELFHALQDQRFNISGYNMSTRELHNAHDGIIEGDGNYVDHRYQTRCEGVWNGSCLLPKTTTSQNADFDPHFGIYQIMVQPYSDGVAFVRDRYREGGWEAVTEVYETPPASTEQIIHPEKYPDDEPTPITITDTSGETWRQIDRNDSVNYASVGEAGLFVTLWYQSFETRGLTSIIPLQSHINTNETTGAADAIDPYNYNSSYTAGWDGDKLVPYVTDNSTQTNETGYVYRLVWDTPADAEEFHDGYVQLLRYHDAEPVSGHANTYRIPDEKPFGDAFYVTVDEEWMTIVNAPTVADLSKIRADAAPTVTERPEPTTETTTASEPTTEPTTELTAEPTTTAMTTTATGAPGLTAGVALVALVAVAVLAMRRR